MDAKSYVVKVPFACNSTHLKEPLDTDDLIQSSSEVVCRAINVITEALNKAGLDKNEIDEIILVGGSSQLPGVKKQIRELLGKDPCEIPRDLMLAVAYGAALYHRDIFNLPKAKRDKRILGDTLGIFVDDGGKKIHKILLDRKQVLPAQAKYSFSVEEGQEIVTINLVIMEDNYTKNLQQRNLKLGKNAKEIEVVIHVDENRLIVLQAYDPKHPDERSVIQCDTKSLTAIEIKKKQKELGIKSNSLLGTQGSQDCIGIDLGTTTSELTYCNRTGEPKLFALENPEPVGDKDLAYSKYCFPSVVFYKDGIRDIQIANTIAVNAIGSDDNCYDSFKIRDRFKPIGEAGGTPVMVRDLTALLLEKIKKSAQENLPTPPTSAVITVPAAFTFDECQDTYNSAEIAGFEKITLIDEPTAAFLYYKHIQELNLDQIRNVLVFDFGGGTSDVAILDVKHSTSTDGNDIKDCIYSVLATCGDIHCGGRDVDNALMKLVCARFEEHTGCKVAASSMRELRKRVEMAKITLSEAYRESCQE